MCLEKLSELKLNSIAIPAIGTGVLAYPANMVANEICNATIDFLINRVDWHLNIIFVVYDQDTHIKKVNQKTNVFL